MTVSFRPLHSTSGGTSGGAFGAEVVGVPADLAVSEEDFRAIEEAWFKHSILLFRNLAMTPEQHIAFTRRLGPLHIMKELSSATLPGLPEVFVVSNATKDGKPIGVKRAGEGFHTDGEDKPIPNAGSFLYAIEVPPERGDTLFVDMYAAYEALPNEVKRKIAGRRARFSRIDLHEVHYPLLPPLTEEQKKQRTDVFHPLLRRHPRSGRTALYIGRWAIDIEGLPHEEGRDLVQYLQAWTQQDRFIYRQVWQAGDAVLWDNRCTQHCATGSTMTNTSAPCIARRWRATCRSWPIRQRWRPRMARFQVVPTGAPLGADIVGFPSPTMWPRTSRPCGRPGWITWCCGSGIVGSTMSGRSASRRNSASRSSTRASCRTAPMAAIRKSC